MFGPEKVVEDLKNYWERRALVYFEAIKQEYTKNMSTCVTICGDGTQVLQVIIKFEIEPQVQPIVRRMLIDVGWTNGIEIDNEDSDYGKGECVISLYLPVEYTI